jgi:hypothetical protein
VHRERLLLVPWVVEDAVLVFLVVDAACEGAELFRFLKGVFNFSLLTLPFLRVEIE